jgi:hypothetical protein
MKTFRMHRGVLAIVACVLSLCMGWGVAAAQEASPPATPAGTGIEGAVAWLVAQQGEDGAFIGFTGEPDAGVTVDAILALAAANHAGVDTGPAIDLALGYLESGDVALVYVQTGVGQAAKLVLALHAAGQDPLDFAHVQPLTIVENGVNPDTGLHGTGVFDHALAILALAATGTDAPQGAIDALTATQAENGGWAFDGSTDPAMADSNTTALVVQALVADGIAESDLVTSGLAYLESTWTDGGYGYNDAEGTVPDANSTALAIQALVATGQDATSQLDALNAYQNASGAFHYNADDPSDNLYATLQAIPALAQAPFPIEPVATAATPEASLARAAA